MRYLFRKASTEHAPNKTSHTVKHCRTHSCIWQSNLSKQMCHMMFQSSAFFLSLSHSIKAISVFLTSLCDLGKNFSRVFFHSGSPGSSLFPSSKPSETTLPKGIHLFSHGDKFECFQMVSLRIKSFACQFLKQKGLCFQICTEKKWTTATLIHYLR